MAFPTQSNVWKLLAICVASLLLSPTASETADEKGKSEPFGDHPTNVNSVISRFACRYEYNLRTCSVVLEINGPIKADTVDAFKGAVAHAAELPTDGEWTVEINSPGGRVESAMMLGRLLRKLEASISLKRDATCLSACIFVLVGAVQRNIYGRVGIHRPRLDTTSSQAVTSEAIVVAYQRNLERMRDYFAEMNVSRAFADRMVTIPPDKMLFLSILDLEENGVFKFDRAWKENLDSQTQIYGLDQREFVRRRALAKRLCPEQACYEHIMKHGQ